MSNKKRFPALRIEQPLAPFFVVSIKADQLLDITFSEPLEYKSETGEMIGNQRRIDHKRLSQIGNYIDTVEMTFPNCIIMSVNQNESGFIIEEKNERWEVVHKDGMYFLDIPLSGKSASIIDGQHRINGFIHSKNPERLKMDLVCAVFFELPNPYQAYLFATINGNQKRVDKSLALEQFGYYVADEPSQAWTPEKLAANITRKLNFSENSPLHGLIKLSPIFNNEDFIDYNQTNWIISTATMMEGIISLISSNYKRDRIEMMHKRIFKGRDREMLSSIKDSSPLRKDYLDNKDQFIEKIIFDFFSSVKMNLWNKSTPNSYIKKTVGVQALFELLKTQLKLKQEFDEKIIKTLVDIDFDDNYFQASGIGKTRIKNVLLIKNKLKHLEEIKSESDRLDIMRIIGDFA